MVHMYLEAVCLQKIKKMAVLLFLKVHLLYLLGVFPFSSNQSLFKLAKTGNKSTAVSTLDTNTKGIEHLCALQASIC